MTAINVKFPTERSVRLTAGLIMFAYATCHLISHATGLFLLDGIQAIGHDIILAPWRTPIGLSLLLVAFLTHLGLGLAALYRRRHLRMPPIEACQLAFGLTIPLLLAPHVTNARLAVILDGFEDSYFRELYQFWITDPAVGLTRQFFLLVFVWVHGCIGIHMWLRYRQWYQRRIWMFAIAAATLPVLAILGITNAGWDTIYRAAIEPGFAVAHGPPAVGTAKALAAASLKSLVTRFQLGYIALLGSVLGLRALRNAIELRKNSIRVRYKNGKQVTAPRGYSILEVSRWAKIPHASVCGARGRCSTCRVRVIQGLEELPPPNRPELATLQRINAPVGVRLACQVRPTADVCVHLLVPADRPLDGLRVELDEGRELFVTALFVDLRDSTRLAAGRLPFDAMFIVDRYVQATTGAIHRHRGHVTSVAGDGIMSVFGLDGDAVSGARNALIAANAIWRAIDNISRDLAEEIGASLAFGIGLHSGLSVLGAVGHPDRPSLQFLGDTGNVAAKLESLTKERGCKLIVSMATLATAQWPQRVGRVANVNIRGHDSDTEVILIDGRLELSLWLTSMGVHQEN
jgi:adenylate cyclase